VEYAARAAYDPREVSNFFEVLGRLSAAGDRETIPGWLSTHPDPPERVQTTRMLAQQWIQMLGLPPERMAINRDNIIRALDGLVFGNDPREGFSEAREFYHPMLEFQIAFPDAWQVENTRNAVIALDPQKAAQMQLTVAKVPAGTTAVAFARGLAQQGMVPERSEETTINGNRAFVGIYVIRGANGPLAAEAAFIEYRNQIFEIVGLTTDFRRYSDSFDRTIRSFTRLTDQRILRAQPDRIRVYTAKDGDTLTLLAKRYDNPRVPADQLAILNRLAVDAPITQGRLVKIVEKGY
jgi:predicted Zn-dependent protease